MINLGQKNVIRCPKSLGLLTEDSLGETLEIVINLGTPYRRNRGTALKI